MPKITSPEQRLATDMFDAITATDATAKLAVLPAPTTTAIANERRALIKQAEAALCRMRRNTDRLLAESGE